MNPSNPRKFWFSNRDTSALKHAAPHKPGPWLTVECTSTFTERFLILVSFTLRWLVFQLFPQNIIPHLNWDYFSLFLGAGNGNSGRASNQPAQVTMARKGNVCVCLDAGDWKLCRTLLDPVPFKELWYSLQTWTYVVKFDRTFTLRSIWGQLMLTFISYGMKN